MRRPNLVGWIALSAVAVAAAIGITLAITSATAGPTLDEAAGTCGGWVATDGQSLEFTALDMSAVSEFMAESARQTLRETGIGTTGDVTCLLGMLDAPSGTMSLMENTRALDGTQTAEWGDYMASWTYHPDDGLNLIIERR